MMELTFQHNIEELPAMLAFNYDELKEGLQNYLSRFEGLVVTEDMIKSAEADRAAINRTLDAIKRARIDIKKRAFDAFEQKAKELETMCDKASEGIAAQLRKFEQKRQEEKQKAVCEILAEVINRTCADDVPMEQSDYWRTFCNSNWNRSKGAWKNSGTSLDSIQKELEAEVARVQKDAATLQSFVESEPIDIRTVAHDKFYAAFNLAETLDYLKGYKEEQKRIAAAKAAEDARKAELAKRTPEPTPTPTDAPQTHENAPTDAQAGAGKETYRLEVTGTREALTRLKAYGTQLGITFKNIDR
jgi:hypothetical protein